MALQPASLQLRRLLFLSLLWPMMAADFARSQQLKPPEAHWQLGSIPMKDGIRLAYLLYKPAKEGRFPVLVTYDAYWGGGTPLRQEELEFLRHGYAVAGVSVRGTGASGGVFSGPFGKQESADGKAVIEWIGSQPWCDGNVGMYGTAHAGVMQFAVGARRPKYLKALVAGSVWSDTYEDVSYPGGIFNIGLMSEWSFYSQPHLSSRGAQVRGFAGPGAGAKLSLTQPAVPGRSFEEMRAHPWRDAWWVERSFEDAALQIEVPTLIIQGWQDQQTGAGGALRLFQNLKGPKRILLSNGGEGIFALPPMRAERIRWFDRWLKGQQNGVDQEPGVTIWFETREDKPELKSASENASRPVEKPPKASTNPNSPAPSQTGAKPAWISTFANWPIAETQWSTWYLSDDAQLSQDKPTTEKGAGPRAYLYPIGTEVASTNALFSAPPAALGCLVYRTAPLAEDMAIVGAPVLTLYISSEQKDSDFMAVLHDVKVDLSNLRGETTYIQRGFLRASHRVLDPKKSSARNPFHSHEKAEELTPGKVYELQFSLLPVGHVVRRGHSLELAIMAPPTIPSPRWAFAPAAAPGLNRIYHSPKHPSNLALPLVPGLKAQAAAPPFGSLPLQPSRELLPSWEMQRRIIDQLLQLRNLAVGGR